MPHRRQLLAACVTLWAVFIVACSGGKGDAPKIDAVGDGPAVEVAPNKQDERASEAALVARREPNLTPESHVAKLEAAAAEAYLDLALPADAPPEVAAAAKANVVAARASWVRSATKLSGPVKYGAVDPNGLNVGDAGKVSGTFEIVRVDSDAVVVRTGRGQMFAVADLDTSNLITGRGLALNDVFECYRTGRFGAFTVPVIRRKSTTVTHDPFDEKADAVAAERERKALAARSDAEAALARARGEALDRAVGEAKAAAAKQIPFPDDVPGEVRIRAKLAHDKLEKKLVDEARAAVESKYADRNPQKK